MAEIDKHQNRKSPSVYENLEQWESNRRTFLRGALIAGAMTQIGLFTSCSSKLEKANDILTAEQSTILTDVLAIFFPNDGNGPDYKDINAFGYILWVLADDLNRKTTDNAYIIEGLDWANEMALEFYFMPFVELDQKQKEALISNFTVFSWGKKWSSVIITLLLEALLLDPIYGGNTDQVGWKWLKHTPGYPRPTDEIRYEIIMEKQMKINTNK